MQPIKKTYSVYILLCPLTKHIKYVGCSCNPSTRINTNSTVKKAAWIDKMNKYGKKPIQIIVGGGLSKQDALRMESCIIKECESNNVKLVNQIGSSEIIKKSHCKARHRYYYVDLNNGFMLQTCYNCSKQETIKVDYKLKNRKNGKTK